MWKLASIALAVLLVPLLAACSGGTPSGTPPSEAPDAAPSPTKETPSVKTPENAPSGTPSAQPGAPPAPAKTETATFAGGCFWCTEAVFEQVPGVVDVRSGFMGGKTAHPSYAQVCEGDTGHAEVVQVTFDPSKVSYAALLQWFWKSHDPTSLNRQGADEGTQYRSAVFVHSPEQRAAAEASKAELQKALEDPVVTEISDAGPFTEADEAHQDYYRQNRAAGYCRVVIAPKLKKLGLRE